MGRNHGRASARFLASAAEMGLQAVPFDPEPPDADDALGDLR